VSSKTADMTNYQITGTMIIPPVETAFKAWIKLVEAEQQCRGILKNIIINRQWLYYLWQNGYTPYDALLNISGSGEHAAA
jgi:hypothetical protein